MATRYIGDAVVRIEYVGEEDGRSMYKGTVRAGKKTWRFSDLGSPVGGFRFASDHPRAYDAMAASAVAFGSYYTTDNRPERGSDELRGMPSGAVADAISEATSWAQDDRGEFAVRRSKKGEAVPEGRAWRENGPQRGRRGAARKGSMKHRKSARRSNPRDSAPPAQPPGSEGGGIWDSIVEFFGG